MNTPGSNQIVQFVTPKVYLIGYSTIDFDGLKDYLNSTGNIAFVDDILAAKNSGLSDGEILCSFYAKLCYASLTLGANKNLSRIREIPDNLIGCFNQGHGSVFEHASLNFVVTDCSRVYTHEQVRHRAGSSYSQTSGRYVRTDVLSFIHDPLLDEVKGDILSALIELKTAYDRIVEKLDLDSLTDFNKKKKLTSALRRILPNGQGNEIGMTLNLRSLRHIMQLRTSRFSEWEIRNVYSQVYSITKDKFPLLYYGAKEEMVDGLVEVSGMKMQPYENLEKS